MIKSFLIDVDRSVETFNDNLSDVIKTISYSHHEIHGGSSYTAHFSNTTTNDDDHRTVIGIETPDTVKWCHFVATVAASSAAEFYILENPTIDLGAETADVSMFNRQRNSQKTSSVMSLAATQLENNVSTYVEAAIAAANLSGGTQIEHTVLQGGSGPKAIGGQSRGSQEWILAQGTRYLFVVQNVGASINLHNINIDWYEHTNK